MAIIVLTYCIPHTGNSQLITTCLMDTHRYDGFEKVYSCNFCPVLKVMPDAHLHDHIFGAWQLACIDK